MDKIYRWGIIGAGRIAEKFCEALSSVTRSEVYAVASRDKNKARAYAQKYNAPKFYDNYNDLVKDDNVDIVYIATPHPFHFDQTLLCLANDKPVLCEKPMSLSVKQTSEMIAFAQEKKLFFMEGMWTSCMPVLDKILSFIEQDKIGIPKYVHVDFGFSAPVDLDGRLYNKALGGGSILDVGVYPIFLTTLLFGEPSKIESVSKLTVTGVDEYSNIIFEYQGGETAHVVCSIVFNTTIEAEIIGTKGRIKIDNPWYKATTFSVTSLEGLIENYSIPHFCNGFEHEIAEVMHCLDNGLLQSTRMPHKLTLQISKIMDELLGQAGVSY